LSEELKLVLPIVAGLVISLGSLVTCTVKQHEEEQAYQKQHNCKFESKVETANIRSCGKACSRHEIKETYQCDNGALVYLK